VIINATFKITLTDIGREWQNLTVWWATSSKLLIVLPVQVY